MRCPASPPFASSDGSSDETNLGRRSNVFLFCADIWVKGKIGAHVPTWAKRSRLSQCWRCTPLARRGHGPHVGALVPTSADDPKFSVGGGEKGYHFGGEVVPYQGAVWSEPFPLVQEGLFRTARSRQGRAVVVRGAANP